MAVGNIQAGRELFDRINGGTTLEHEAEYTIEQYEGDGVQYAVDVLNELDRVNGWKFTQADVWNLAALIEEQVEEIKYERSGIQMFPDLDSVLDFIIKDTEGK